MKTQNLIKNYAMVVIPIHEIPKGIAYLKHWISLKPHWNIAGMAAKWENFWDYFDKQWCKATDPHDWNIHDLIGKLDSDSHRLLVNLTNNPLERYNREMKCDFQSARPPMMEFVDTIQRHANSYIARIDAMDMGTAGTQREHDAPIIFEVPQAYKDFVFIV